MVLSGDDTLECSAYNILGNPITDIIMTNVPVHLMSFVGYEMETGYEY